MSDAVDALVREWANESPEISYKQWLEKKLLATRELSPSIVCPRCLRRSYHPKDIEERYCGHCHEWHPQMLEAIELRSAAEIQAAHDRLTAIVLEDVPNPLQCEITAYVPALDVLCWVLKHDHNQKFALNLKTIDERLRSMGYELKREGQSAT